MASEIRVNRLSNRSGLSTITFANGGVQFSGITTFANGEFYVGTGSTILNPSGNELQFHTGGSNRFTINNSGANLGTGNITAVDATFTGNVSIGKTLTYEDVKNVDSVGVVTARTGVKITGGDFTVGTAITASAATGNVTQDVGITTFSGSATWFKGLTANKDMYWSKSSGSLIFKDNAAALFGNSSDLQIKHDGSDSIIHQDGTGDLRLRSDNSLEFNTNGTANAIWCDSGAAVKLYYNNSLKFLTTNTGATVTGELTIGTTTVTGNNLTVQDAGTSTTAGGNICARFQSNGSGRDATIQLSDNVANSATISMLSSALIFKQAGTETFHITAGGNLLVGRSSNYWNSRAAFHEDKNGRTAILVKNDTNHADSSSSIILNAYGNSWTMNCGSTARDSNSFTINQDATSNSNQGTERFRITTGGNVGIDRTSPNTKLDIKAPPVNSSTLTTTNCKQLGLLITPAGTGNNSSGHIYTGLAVGDGYAGLYGIDAGASEATSLSFFTGSNSAVAERFRIQSDGKVMIGRPASGSASRNLTVTSAAGNSQVGEIGLHPTNSSGGMNPEVIFQAISDGTTTGAHMAFVTRDSAGNRPERLRIDSSGNVIVNNTTATAGSYNYKLLAADQITSSEQTFGIQYTGTVTYGLNAESNADFTIKKDGTERLRIDSSGRLLLGTTTNSSPIGWNNNLQVAGTNAQAGISIRRDENGTGGALLIFGKSRGSLNGNTVVQNGDQIGGMYFAGADGTDVNSIAAQISVEVAGPPGGNDMPGRILFKTTADGASSPTERLRIDNAGVLYTGNYSTTLDATPGSIQINGGTSGGRLGFRGTTTSAGGGLGEMHGYWDTNKVASILFHAGSDTSNKDDGEIRMYTRPSGGSAAERLRIDSSGKIKLGSGGTVVNPADVEIRYDNPVLLIRDTASTSADNDAKIGFGNESHYPVAYMSHVWDGTNGTLTFHTRLSGNESEKLRIDSSGNLSLGTVTSIQKFTINNGGISIDNGWNVQWGVNASRAYIQGEDANGNNRLLFGTNNKEALRIDSSGTVSVNSIQNYDSGLLRVYGKNAGTAGVIAGGVTSGQSTGYMEVNQDGQHGGGMFYNGDGSPSFATGESADQFSLYRNQAGTRHVVVQWPYDSNDSLFKGNMNIDNGTSTLLRVTADSGGTAGVSAGGDSGQNQSTGYVEVHQDRIHGGGIFYNGDGSPAFATDESADRVTFYRMHNGTRYEVFSCPYSNSALRFRGDVRPATNNTTDLGSDSIRWRDVYCNQGAFNNSDETLKQDIASLTTTEMNVAKRLSGLFKTYRWKDAVEEKGTDKARTHTGIIAQQIVTAMEAEGLDYTKYGFIGYGEWYENDKGEVIELEDVNDNNLDGYTKVGRYSVRYTELLSFIAAYNDQRFLDLETRVAALEGS